MFLVDIHKLNVILADPVGVGVLKHQVDYVGRVVRFERQDVILLRCAEHFCQRDEVDSQRNVAVASVRREAFGPQDHGDERDVRVVHGLKGDAGVIAVEVAVLNEILDRVDDLRNSVE